MATFLDISLLENFSVIFSFILVFGVVYGILAFTRVLGDRGALNAIIALCIAILSLFSHTALTFINVITPWLVALLFFAVFLIMMYKLFGASDEDIATVIRKHSGVQWVIAITFIVLGVMALGYSVPAFSGEKGTTGTTTVGPLGTDSNLQPEGGFSTAMGEEAAIKTIVHPKVLGMIVTLAIAVFTIVILTGYSRAPWPP